MDSKRRINALLTCRDENFAANLEVMIGYALFSSVDERDVSVWKHFIDALSTRFIDLYDASSKFSNEEVLSLYGLVFSFSITFASKQERTTIYWPKLIELFEIAK